MSPSYYCISRNKNDSLCVEDILSRRFVEVPDPCQGAVSQPCGQMDKRDDTVPITINVDVVPKRCITLSGLVAVGIVFERNTVIRDCRDIC